MQSDDGWEHVQHISVTKDLHSELDQLQTQYTASQVAYVRALSFVYPQKSAMEEVALKWKNTVDANYGGIVPWDETTLEENQKHGNDNNDSVNFVKVSNLSFFAIKSCRL